MIEAGLVERGEFPNNARGDFGGDGAAVFVSEQAQRSPCVKGQAQLYVQMAGAKGWVRVEDITFASGPGALTARGYGYLPYPEEEARRLSPDHWARGWHDLVRELAAKKK